MVYITDNAEAIIAINNTLPSLAAPALPEALRINLYR
jgi:hypothetical protein